MWRNPEINRAGVLATWSTVSKELDRLIDGLLAILGILGITTRLVVTRHEFKHLIRG